MPSVNEVLKKLKERAKPENIEGMAKYGMTRVRRLGVADKVEVKTGTRPW